ncbi:MAG: DUF1015 domain-containing protein [Firmicutes bacterium]|nr:DUF1015 domain-containing protein [Bacillota bacterium]
MATIRAFRAVRPKAEYAEKVISLPYDVMNREEAARMAEGNPYSFLHICRAEIDMPEQKDPYAGSVYEKARDKIKDYMMQGVLFREEKPMLYIYRQIMGENLQTGIVCCVSVDEYRDGLIKKHELTRIDKELDRINHFDVCNADTEPVFLTYRDDTRIRGITDKWADEHDAEYDIKTSEGIRHILWKIDDEGKIAEITSLFADIPAMYIADGHHRSASAYKVGLKRREENKGFSGSEEFNFFMAAVFPAGDLKIFDYNRVIKDLNGLSESEFIEAVRSAGFDVTKIGNEARAPEKCHTFTMHLAGEWYELTARNEIIPNDLIGALDVSILQEKILSPILGIEDPRTDERIGFVGGVRGLSELEKRCAEDMKAAFAVYPIDVSELMKAADAGLIMPPKSTWFEPKLASGLFMHEL